MENNTDLKVGQHITRKVILGRSSGPELITETIEVVAIENGKTVALGRIVESADNHSVGRHAPVFFTEAERATGDALVEAQFEALAR